MKVSKAFEILTKYQKDYLSRIDPDFDDAVKLGSEALKLMLEWRQALPKDNPCFLPGETNE